MDWKKKQEEAKKMLKEAIDGEYAELNAASRSALTEMLRLEEEFRVAQNEHRWSKDGRDTSDPSTRVNQLYRQLQVATKKWSSFI